MGRGCHVPGWAWLCPCSLLSGMQDFNYLYTNCFEITLELSCNKFPPQEDLEREWLANREALVAFMEEVECPCEPWPRAVGLRAPAQPQLPPHPSTWGQSSRG